MLLGLTGVGISMSERAADELEFDRDAGLILPGQTTGEERVGKRK